MRTYELLLGEVKKYLEEEDIRQIEKAYKWILDGNEIDHCLRCAISLSELRMDASSIIASLIHIKSEDPSIDEEDIEELFEEDVKELTIGLLTLVTITRKTINSILPQDLEHLRRFLIISAKDIRVLIIKLSCRLDHLRNVEGKKDPLDYVLNTEDIFLPLAEYIGIDIFKREMEDIIFKIKDPNLHNTIQKEVADSINSREEYINSDIEEIEIALSVEDIKAKIFGRPKTLHSIYKKIIRKEGEFNISEVNNLNDLIAISILVETVPECYKVLGIIHGLWEYEKEEFDDYISKPKPNGFRALQTTIKDSNNRRIEIQIKTYIMHEYNEFGPASHIAYKKSGQYYSKSNQEYQWVKNLSDWKDKNTKQDNYKLNLFEDKIFVLTPKGSVKELPKGATPIDFAYKVHVDIGHSCKGSKVNGALASLNTKLQNGDIVEILTSKNIGKPKKDWLDYVVTSDARHQIRKALNMEE